MHHTPGGTHMCAYPHTCTHVCTQVFAHLVHMSVHMCAYMYTCVLIHVHTTYMHTHTQTHVYIQAHTHLLQPEDKLEFGWLGALRITAASSWLLLAFWRQLFPSALLFPRPPGYLLCNSSLHLRPHFLLLSRAGDFPAKINCSKPKLPWSDPGTNVTWIFSKAHIVFFNCFN